MSLSSLHAALVKSGMAIMQATVSRYIRALLDAKILYACDRFDMKSKRAIQGEKKYYLSEETQRHPTRQSDGAHAQRRGVLTGDP